MNTRDGLDSRFIPSLKTFYLDNRDRVKQYFSDNRDRIKESKSKNHDKIMAQRMIYSNNKYKSDKKFRSIQKTRSRILEHYKEKLNLLEQKIF